MKASRPISHLLTACLLAWAAPAVMAQSSPGVSVDALDQLAPADAGMSLRNPFTGHTEEATPAVSLSFESSGGFGLQADAWQLDATGRVDPLESGAPDGTPARIAGLSGGELAEAGNLRLMDVDRDARIRLPGLSGGQSRGIDLSASYVWESSNFGQFMLSTHTTYVYNQNSTEGVREPGSLPLGENPAMSRVPELQSQLVFTWQVGKHTASATTQYSSDVLEEVGSLQSMDMERLDKLVGDMASLDLRYGYNVQTGENGSTVISIGLRNNFEQRPAVRSLRDSGGVLDADGGVAYGSIKYQF